MRCGIRFFFVSEIRGFFRGVLSMIIAADFLGILESPWNKSQTNEQMSNFMACSALENNKWLLIHFGR